VEPLAVRIPSSTEWLGNSMNGRARRWASKTRAERDLMLVLHRPIEPTAKSGHWGALFDDSGNQRSLHSLAMSQHFEA
jgi:hypothetical protein